MRLPDEVLEQVRKPARYVGGEWNSVAGGPVKSRANWVLIFPDAYEVGVCNLGVQVLYRLLNDSSVSTAERGYSPWDDMEAALRDRGLPLCSLESGTPLSEFDLIGFSLQHELNYSNVLAALESGGVAAPAAARGESPFPLVCAGGPGAANPEPLADFVDFFVIGDGEQVSAEISEVCLAHKRRGTKGRQGKRALLADLAGLEGVYVSSFYRPEYDERGRLREMRRVAREAPDRVRRRWVADLDAVPLLTRPLVPFAEASQERVAVEIARGCLHGCRFCQAAFTNRPYRERRLEGIVRQAVEALDNTGFEAVSLLSLSSLEHGEIGPMVERLAEELEPRGVALTFPSTRVDCFDPDLFERAGYLGRPSVTLAPEAGSERLRRVINKGATREQLLEIVARAFAAGWDLVKLYYMIGLPAEGEEDLRALVEEVRAVHALGAGRRGGRRPRVRVSVSTFIPKPHTPFQWERQIGMGEIGARQAIILEGLRSKGIEVSWHDARQTTLEGALSRGDRRLGEVVARAVAQGARFDNWSERFEWGKWEEAFAAAGLAPGEFLRERDEDEALPWETIDVGVSRAYLLEERRRADQGQPTPDCRAACAGCGIGALVGGDSACPARQGAVPVAS